MNNSHPIIQINSLTKLFGTKPAVNKISLSINQGEIFGFLGPNGAGKTTTIRMMLDVLRPSDGTITLFGQSNQKTKETHRKIGYLSGEMVIDGDLSGIQYLNFVDHQYGGGSRHRIKELANLLHVDLNTRIDSYSRGNRQKIALISAIMHKPELLILDEPTSGFDPLVQETFMSLIKQYQSDGGTVFMSSHILSEVQRLCSRVGFIKDGSLIGVKDITDLRANSSKTIQVSAPETEISKIKAKYKTINGLKVQTSEKTSIAFVYSGDVQSLLKFFGAYQLSDITIAEPELEEIFLDYYNEKKN